MEQLIKDIIYLLVGISVLLVGMKLMSSGLKKSIGHGIRRFFKKTHDKPFISLGIGTVVTAGIQSSDATNAMVIGFINVGAMTLYQGLCIMLGAYIGTTVTGILASFSSLSISVYFLLFSFIGIIMMFFNKEKIKNIGEILTGLGFLFFGLAVMKDSFKNPDITSFCQNMFSTINFGPLLFLIGVLITAVIQSSSAVTSIAIAMVGSSALGLSAGLYIVLGATLGTVATTLLTSLGGNIQGKRAAIIAFFLRLITSLIMLIILVILEKPITQSLHHLAINGSDELPIALFTVFYNIVFMPLLIPFLKPSIKLFTKLIKDKSDNNLAKNVHFIDDKLLNSPNIASMQVKKEIVNMFDLSYENYQNSINLIKNKDIKIIARMNEIEDQIDYLNNRITDFLINLSSKVLPSSEKKIGAYFHVINDIERIGDHAINFLNMYKEMEGKDLYYSGDALNDISKMDNVIVEMFLLTKDIFENKKAKELTKLHRLESETDKLTKQMAADHYERIKAKTCKNELTPFYSSLITEFERIGDHLTNIGYSIINPVGDTK